MSDNATRPCQPGDVLATATAPCGARYVIEVGQPAPHPHSGTSEDHQVRLALTVTVPTEFLTLGAGIRPALRSEKSVLGQALVPGWGKGRESARALTRRRDGAAIAPLLVELSTVGREALATVQAVADAHATSVALQASARAAAYAAWPVAAGKEG